MPFTREPVDLSLIAEEATETLLPLAEERGLAIELTDEALDLLGNVGFDPVYGARPLKRAIQAQLENPLAQKILSGEFTSGATIHVGAEGGHLVFR